MVDAEIFECVPPKVQRRVKWKKFLDAVKYCYVFIPKDQKKEILHYVSERIGSEKFDQKGERLFLDLFIALFSYARCPVCLSNALNFFDLLRDYIDDTFALSYESEAFRNRYAFLMLYMKHCSVKEFKKAVIEELFLLKKMLKGRVKFEKVVTAYDEDSEEIGRPLRFFLALHNLGIDISHELLFYIYTHNKEECRELFEAYLCSGDASAFLKSYYADTEALLREDIEIIRDLIDDTDYVKEKLLSYMRNDKGAIDNRVFCAEILSHRFDTRDVVEVISDFMEVLFSEHNASFKKRRRSVRRDGRAVCLLQIYRTYPFIDMEWEHGKYASHVVKYPAILDKHPYYLDGCPYFIMNTAPDPRDSFYRISSRYRALYVGGSRRSLLAYMQVIEDAVREDMAELNYFDRRKVLYEGKC